MKSIGTVILYFGFILIVSIISKSLKKSGRNNTQNGPYRPGQSMPVNRPSSMAHTHSAPNSHETYNGRMRDNSTGAQPHVHETRKYKSMADASQLPKGYILLNGEPVRVADLEGK